MIFQDPYSSLDPRMTVYDIIAEPLRINKVGAGSSIDERVKYLASVVGLDISHLKRYPHAFSGGQRQRIGIARALSTNPKLIVADEPVSALDVSVQAQVINLLEELQKKFGLTYIFVAHDLSVIEHISDRVAVMYVGKIVETAATDQVFSEPRHPYTEALMSAVPKPDPRTKMRRIILEGEVPNPAHPPEGCHFHPRCPYAIEICSQEAPDFKEVVSRHFVSCHRAAEISLKGVG
jgi:peptide/nickel transport system ATP-binding protein